MCIPRGPSHGGAIHFSRARPGRCFILSILWAACIVLFANAEARAQCSARDVLQNRLSFRLSAAPAQRPLIQAARDAPIWKRITIGTFADSMALFNELDVTGCKVGGQASEILARPTFTLGSRKTDVDLVAVSPAELGFMSDTVTLAAVYARARQLGFALAAAEVGPQLRLQYFDQPMGEFLIIGMDPIETWSGEPIILNVANGGAGLVLIGQDGRAGAEISATSRVVFVRPQQRDLDTELAEQAGAFLSPASGAFSGRGN